MGSGASNARNKSTPPVQPATSQPATSQPANGQQVTGQSATGQRNAATGQTAKSKPQASPPKSDKAATSQPATGQSVSGQPATSQPATGQPATDQSARETKTIAPNSSSSDQPLPQPPTEKSDEPPSQSQATPPADDCTSPEKADNSKIVSECTKFLDVATMTGGETARCSPNDSKAFERKSADRKTLFSDLDPALKHLRDTPTYTDDASMKSLLDVCKLSNVTDPAIADDLVEKGYPDLFLKIWNGVYHEDIYTSKKPWREYIVLNLLKQASISFTHVSRKLCAAMGSAEQGLVARVAEEFKHPAMKLSALNDKGATTKAVWHSTRETLKKTVNVLANIIRGNIDSKPVFRQAEIVPHLNSLLDCRFMIMRAKALFCLVYLLNEDENEALNTTDSNIDFVIKVLGKCLKEKGHYSQHYTFSAEVVVDGIAYLAENDDNKVKLVKKGVTDLLITMLKTDKVAEKRTAAKAVWKLVFHDDNKKKFKENTVLITVLKELHSSESDAKLLQACKTVLWMLDVNTESGESSSGKTRPATARSRTKTTENTNKKESGIPDEPEENGGDDGDEAPVDDDDLDDDMPHVMISYQWDVQQQMIKVKEFLRAAGYNVWMDVDNMGGSTLESMAAAVERSAVVLVCFTEKYKRSASCRTEAEYTYKLRKPIVPLRLQSDYDPDGWLGIMIGTKLYVDLSRPDMLEEDVNKLTQQIGNRGRMTKDGLNSTAKSNLQDTLNGGEDQKGGVFQRGASTRRSTIAKNTGGQDRHIDAKTVSTWDNDQVNAWLAKNELAGLKNRFDGYTGQRLLGLKTISTEAPEFFYSELKKDLGFKNLLEIVSFKQALDEII